VSARLIHASVGRVSPEAVLARSIAEHGGGSASQAEAELYRRLAPRARLYGLKHLRDHAAADDLAHEVLIHAIESLRAGRVREPDRIASFVLGCCRMWVHEIRKVAARREQILERSAAAELPPTAELAVVLDRQRLESCLQHLAPKLLTLIVLTFYAEASGEEIARTLGTTPGNVRVMRHRTLSQLHACIEKAS
jgi:RNA polymerase sigma-70 factor (ECF subfamily)